MAIAFQQCTIWKTQPNQEGTNSNGTHRLLVYANYINLLGERTYTVKKNTEALQVT
jgi:hypothetical protein